MNSSDKFQSSILKSVDPNLQSTKDENPYATVNKGSDNKYCISNERAENSFHSEFNIDNQENEEPKSKDFPFKIPQTPSSNEVMVNSMIDKLSGLNLGETSSPNTQFNLYKWSTPLKNKTIKYAHQVVTVNHAVSDELFASNDNVLVTNSGDLHNNSIGSDLECSILQNRSLELTSSFVGVDGTDLEFELNGTRTIEVQAEEKNTFSDSMIFNAERISDFVNAESNIKLNKTHELKINETDLKFIEYQQRLERKIEEFSSASTSSQTDDGVIKIKPDDLTETIHTGSFDGAQDITCGDTSIVSPRELSSTEVITTEKENTSFSKKHEIAFSEADFSVKDESTECSVEDTDENCQYIPNNIIKNQFAGITITARVSDTEAAINSYVQGNSFKETELSFTADKSTVQSSEDTDENCQYIPNDILKEILTYSNCTEMVSIESEQVKDSESLTSDDSFASCDSELKPDFSVTEPEDLETAEKILELSCRTLETRTSISYDGDASATISEASTAVESCNDLMKTFISNDTEMSANFSSSVTDYEKACRVTELAQEMKFDCTGCCNLQIGLSSPSKDGLAEVSMEVEKLEVNSSQKSQMTEIRSEIEENADLVAKENESTVKVVETEVNSFEEFCTLENSVEEINVSSNSSFTRKKEAISETNPQEPHVNEFTSLKYVCNGTRKSCSNLKVVLENIDGMLKETEDKLPCNHNVRSETHDISYESVSSDEFLLENDTSQSSTSSSSQICSQDTQGTTVSAAEIIEKDSCSVETLSIAENSSIVSRSFMQKNQPEENESNDNSSKIETSPNKLSTEMLDITPLLTESIGESVVVSKSPVDTILSDRSNAESAVYSSTKSCSLENLSATTSLTEIIRENTSIVVTSPVHKIQPKENEINVELSKMGTSLEICSIDTSNTTKLLRKSIAENSSIISKSPVHTIPAEEHGIKADLSKMDTSLEICSMETLNTAAALTENSSIISKSPVLIIPAEGDKINAELSKMDTNSEICSVDSSNTTLPTKNITENSSVIFKCPVPKIHLEVGINAESSKIDTNSEPCSMETLNSATALTENSSIISSGAKIHPEDGLSPELSKIDISSEPCSVETLNTMALIAENSPIVSKSPMPKIHPEEDRSNADSSKAECQILKDFFAEYLSKNAGKNASVVSQPENEPNMLENQTMDDEAVIASNSSALESSQTRIIELNVSNNVVSLSEVSAGELTESVRNITVSLNSNGETAEELPGPKWATIELPETASDEVTHSESISVLFPENSKNVLSEEKLIDDEVLNFGEKLDFEATEIEFGIIASTEGNSEINLEIETTSVSVAGYSGDVGELEEDIVITAGDESEMPAELVRATETSLDGRGIEIIISARDEDILEIQSHEDTSNSTPIAEKECMEQEAIINYSFESEGTAYENCQGLSNITEECTLNETQSEAQDVQSVLSPKDDEFNSTETSENDIEFVPEKPSMSAASKATSESPNTSLSEFEKNEIFAASINRTYTPCGLRNKSHGFAGDYHFKSPAPIQNSAKKLPVTSSSDYKLLSPFCPMETGIQATTPKLDTSGSVQNPLDMSLSYFMNPIEFGPNERNTSEHDQVNQTEVSRNGGLLNGKSAHTTPSKSLVAFEDMESKDNLISSLRSQLAEMTMKFENVSEAAAILHINETKLKNHVENLNDQIRTLNNRYEMLKEYSNNFIIELNEEREKLEKETRILKAKLAYYEKECNKSVK